MLFLVLLPIEFIILIFSNSNLHKNSAFFNSPRFLQFINIYFFVLLIFDACLFKLIHRPDLVSKSKNSKADLTQNSAQNIRLFFDIALKK